MRAISLSDIGKNRDMNQDFVFSSSQPVGNLPNLFVVADGMGGHNAGEYASQKAVEVIVKNAFESGDTNCATILRKAIKEANSSLLAVSESDNTMQGMGTTIVAAFCDKDKATIVNVGDSRMYHVKEDAVVQVTKDHSLVQEMVRKGEIDKQEAKVHPSKNIITRAVGVQSEVTADFFEVEIKAGQKILLCSDGLTNMLGEKELAEILLDKETSIDNQAQRLIEKANENGGEDNISVIIIDPFDEGE